MTGTNMQVFEFARSWADDMVTIFASNLAQAETIYSEWIETHHPDRPPQSEMVFPYAVCMAGLSSLRPVTSGNPVWATGIQSAHAGSSLTPAPRPIQGSRGHSRS